MKYQLQLFVADRWIVVEEGSHCALTYIRQSRQRRFPRDLYRIRLAV